MDNNVPHHQYADGPNPNNIFLHIPKWKGWPRKSFVSAARLSFFIAYCWFVWPWANIQMRCWEFKLRVSINYSLLIHPVYLMLVFNEKCQGCGPQCTVVQCSPNSPPPPADVFNFILFHAKFGSVIYNPGPGGLEGDYMSWLETWSLGLMIVYRNVTMICSMLNKTLKTPTLLDSGWPLLRYRFYNWSGFNGSFVLHRLAESFRRICRSQQQQVRFWYSSVYLQIILLFYSELF